MLGFCVLESMLFRAVLRGNFKDERTKFKHVKLLPFYTYDGKPGFLKIP